MRYSLAAIGFVMLALPVEAQIVFTTTGTISQNFDTLPVSGTANTWTNNVTVTGAFAFQGSGSSAVTVIRASDGVHSADLSSFGTGTSMERAWGATAGGSTQNLAYGFIVFNNSTESLAFNLGYTGEQWRDGGASVPNPHTLAFSYQVTSSLPSSFLDWDPNFALPAGYTALPALDFTSPMFVETGNGIPLDGNLSANQTTFLSTNIPVAILPGNYLIMRWFDLNNMGNDHALSLDNVSIQAVTAVPEPSLVLAISAAGMGFCRLLRRRTA